MIDDSTIQKIKDAASIVDVISDFYQLRKRGVEYECKCPFHADRHMGSFKISPKKNYAKCFSCGWQGAKSSWKLSTEHYIYFPYARRLKTSGKWGFAQAKKCKSAHQPLILQKGSTV